MAHGNGRENEGTKVNQIVLTFDPATFGLNVGGSCENYDMALAMLDMARRFFEGKIRNAQAADLIARPGFALPGIRGKQ